jgi:hypothetical protein
MLSSSKRERGRVLTPATKWARALRSTPTIDRPRARASMTAVPPPIKGSSTQSPGFENISMTALAMSGENRAGYR